jgi:O-antigen/teichoic acid export membrane protein
MDENLKKEAKKGIIWSAVQRFSMQGLQFLTTLVMARQLTPDDYGIIGMLSVFIGISSVFIDSGFINALTRKQDRTQADICTVFYFNIGVALLAYFILFLTAPLIANFYGMEVLCPVLRVFSLVLIINSFSAVQATLLTIKLDFKTQAKVSIISLLVSAAIGIAMAYNGFSYWAIVALNISSSLISTALFWYYSRWRPSLLFSKSSFKSMFAFGSKLLASSLIDSIYNNIYSLVIGKFFAAKTLGNYSRAESYANFPSISMTGIMQRVTYPVLCKMQDDEQQLAHAYRKFLKLSAFVIFPLMMGLSALSHAFVVITIGPQWTFCAVLLQILCFSLMWYPIQVINLNLLQVKGRTDLSLKLEVIKKIIGTAILFASIPFGIVVMCCSRVLYSIICLFINSFYSKELINLSVFKQLRDILPTLLISFAMFLIVTAFNHFFTNQWIQISIGAAVGAISYIILSYLFNKDEFKSVLSLIKK